MNKLHNKHGPDPDIGYEVSRRSRDGTGRMPRDGIDSKPSDWTIGRSRDGTAMRPPDGTIGRSRDGTAMRPRDGTIRRSRDGTAMRPRDGTAKMPRDGIVRMPRDGIFRMPRDSTIKPMGSFVINHFYLIAQLPRDAQIRGKTHSRWRKTIRKNRAFGPVMGEVRPDENRVMTMQLSVNMLFTSFEMKKNE